MEGDDQDKYQNQDEEENQSINGGTQAEEANIENKDIPREWRAANDNPIQNVIEYISKGVTTR